MRCPRVGDRVIGVGIDVVDIGRFRRAMGRTAGLAGRLFTPGELTDVAARDDRSDALAEQFAAKESVMKAIGCGVSAAAFTDIEVVVVDSGAVHVDLRGRARARSDELGVGRFTVSTGHAGPLAQAIAIALA